MKQVLKCIDMLYNIPRLYNEEFVPCNIILWLISYYKLLCCIANSNCPDEDNHILRQLRESFFGSESFLWAPIQDHLDLNTQKNIFSSWRTWTENVSGEEHCSWRGTLQERGKTFTTRWSGSRAWVQVCVQVRAPAGHLAISPMPVSEGNRRFRGQNQRPSSWGRSPALLARVGRASTNTRRFRVGSSRCWPRQARLRKTCYHSYDIGSIQEPTRF